MNKYDLAFIGGGIVGVPTALEMTRRYPGMTVVLLEKEPELAQHQTGRNSGVIHAGVYYQPDSLKARFCKAGVDATIGFCRDHGLAYEQCGKLLVATDAMELERMNALEERCKQNGIAIERLDATELKRREPRIAGVGALFTPTTGIVDYGAITRRLAELFGEAGGEVRRSFEVDHLREVANGVEVGAKDTIIHAKNVIVCAGVMADRLARLCGMAVDFQIVPFRGEYYRLRKDKDDIVRHLIYPIPDPALPFLGVHLTRMIGGYVTVGPNAVLALARNGYARTDISPGDLAEMLRFSGFRRLIVANMKSGLTEMRNSFYRRGYLELCRKYCPELELSDLTPYRPGIRAQAVMADGTMIHDFLIRQTARTIHVCNAPSPAATSAMPIANHIAEQATVAFDLPAPGAKA
ncbi:L-2-hydroxyglutarate oxidase [Mesorhizobium sp. M0306]|uniref:L-2-hydroxyglutarate oxidase n=1 Tax=Mesorhizobium sp. M0306 TaxID=2956932 RepID=UPI0033394B06